MWAGWSIQPLPPADAMVLLPLDPNRALAAARRPLPDVCSRCGRCCFEKEYGPNSTVAYGDTPCEYLDPKTLLCTVYADRHACKQGCRSLTLEVIAEGWLPAECTYYTYFSPALPDLRNCFC